MPSAVTDGEDGRGCENPHVYILQGTVRGSHAQKEEIKRGINPCRELRWRKMAKDGTMRGGARVGSGRKSKALTEKIESGLAATVIDLPEPAEISGEEVPPVKDFLKAAQKSGIDLCAEDVFRSTFLWLKERGCDRLVNTQLIEQYAMSVSRWVQCETYISEYGFLAKHPTTGAAITSPYVTMSQNYLKQVNQCWYQIYQIVKENCSVEYGGANPQDDLMEHLLRVRNGP